MARIWMNHWFSTAYNIITLIKEGIPDASIIGSNEHAASPIMNVCEEWYQEPVLKGEQYVSFCLEFCHNHNIDVFMPRREMLSISKYKDRFTEVWENKFQAYRNHEWMHTGSCSDCDAWEFCLGNGMHLRDDNGNLLLCHYK